MINRRTAAQATNWRTRPLCCRYLLLQLEALAVPLCDNGCVRDQVVCWVLGVLADGQHEILGAWLEPDSGAIAWRVVFDDLQVRGVEQVRFVVSNEREAVRASVSAAYSGVTVLPSIGQLLRRSLAQVAPRHRRFGAEVLGAISEVATVQATWAAATDLAASPFGAMYPAVVDCWRTAVADRGPLYTFGPRLRRLVRFGDQTAQWVTETLQRAVARKGRFPSETAAITFISEVLDRVDRGLGTAGPLTGRGVQNQAQGRREASALAGCH